jgi:hypothetical protein
MKYTLIAATLLGASALCQAAKLPLYDNFGGGEIDRTKWNETEAWRHVEGGKAKLGRWMYGGTGADTGMLFDSWNLSMAGGNAPKGLQATIKVTEMAANGCAFNTSPSRSRARIIATYFNVRPGGPLPNDRTGDILAQILVGRASDSSDPENVLRVEGYLNECTTSDCNGGVDRASVPLGTVMLGDPITVRIDWSKSANLFRFSRDGGTPVDVSYTDADGTSSSLPFANLSLRNWAANCISGPRVKTGLAAEFDDVRYNQ